MNVELIESIETLLTVTSNYRAADPLRTNVIGSVAASVLSGKSHYDAYRWWIVTDNGTVVGVAMRPSPFNLVLGPMSHEAAACLGHAIVREDDDVPGVIGSRDVVAAFLKGYRDTRSPGSQRPIHDERNDLIYELGELLVPDVEGLARGARNSEVESLAQMYVDFTVEAVLAPLSLADARRTVTKSVEDGSLFCWVVEDTVVSIAAHAPTVATGSHVIGRIGPVYTPPPFRRHGFGGAVTAHVSRQLLNRGARVMLFTNAANPTSNSIYQAMGYRLIDEMVEVRLEGV